MRRDLPGRVDGVDGKREALFVTAVRFRRQFDDSVPVQRKPWREQAMDLSASEMRRTNLLEKVAVQGDLDIRQFLLGQVVAAKLKRTGSVKRQTLARAESHAQVGIQAPQDGLVTDDEDVLLPLEFENDRFEADHDVAVRLAAAVAVVELVVVARVVVFGIVFLRSRKDPE